MKAIHHIDGDPLNNDPANLRTVDTRDNARGAALARLRSLLRRGTTCYTIQRHRSRSGGTVVVSVLSLNPGVWSNVSRDACTALDLPYDGKRDGVRLDDCDGDPALMLVQFLAGNLYGDASALLHIRL